MNAMERALNALRTLPREEVAEWIADTIVRCLASDESQVVPQFLEDDELALMGAFFSKVTHGLASLRTANEDASEWSLKVDASSLIETAPCTRASSGSVPLIYRKMDAGAGIYSSESNLTGLRLEKLERRDESLSNSVLAMAA